MSWDFEEILELNPATLGQSRSPIERLLAVGAASPELLCFVADEMESRGPNHVAVLFQLPFPVTLERQWERLPTSPDSLFADVSFQRMCLHVDDFGRLNLRGSGFGAEDEEGENVPMAQGLAVFQVWGKRQLIHPRYLAAVERGRPADVVAPQNESWVQNRPMTAEGYEENFSTRLRIEVSSMLARFLPAYSLLSRTEATIPHRVYGFATMLSPGRVTKVGSAFPLLNHFLPQGRIEELPRVRSADLQLALRGAPRELGRFEAQLFAMDRLRREGEVALSVVGTAALLEWLLANRMGAKRGKATLNHLLKDAELHILPPELLALADEVRRTRNGLVHGAPPKRRLARRVGEFTSSGREMGDDQLAPDRARQFIEGVFEIFRLLNQRSRL